MISTRGHRTGLGNESGTGERCSAPHVGARSARSVPGASGEREGPAGRRSGTPSSGRRLTILGIYPWDRFWSMGEFRGAPSFFLAPQALTKAGHSVHISMPGRVGAAVEDYHGIKLHRYRFGIDFMPVADKRFLGHLLRPFRFAYYLLLGTLNGIITARRLGADVVVGYGAFGAPVAFLTGRPFDTPNVTRLFGQSLSLGFRKSRRAKARLILNYAEVIAFLTPCSCLIVCNDGSEGSAVAARLGVPSDRLRYWRNGIDKALFRQPESRSNVKKELGYDPDSPLLLSVGRLDREKHHERLLGSLPQVTREFPSAAAVIVGDGPERAHLAAEAERLGVARSVKFTGALPREEVARYLKASDVFVTVSDRTNIANPTEEAMMCGCCVVALDTGETSDAVRDGETGVLIPYEVLGNLGEILVDLLKNEPRRLELGRRAAVLADELLPSVEERQEMEARAVEAVVK